MGEIGGCALVADVASEMSTETEGAADARAQTAVGQQFRVVAISLGVNEVTCGRKVRRWLAELDELSALLREKFGTQRMLWSGIPAMHEFPCLPQPLRWYLGARARMLNRVLREWTERQADCEFVAAGRRLCGADGE